MKRDAFQARASGKSVSADFRNTFRNDDAQKGGAILKSSAIDLFKIIWEDDAFQEGTSKGAAPDFGHLKSAQEGRNGQFVGVTHIVRDCCALFSQDILDALFLKNLLDAEIHGAIRQRILPPACRSGIRLGINHQFRAIRKSIYTDNRNAFRNENTREFLASEKCIFPDFLQTRGEEYALKVLAILKGIVHDFCHLVSVYQ